MLCACCADGYLVATRSPESGDGFCSAAKTSVAVDFPGAVFVSIICIVAMGTGGCTPCGALTTARECQHPHGGAPHQSGVMTFWGVLMPHACALRGSWDCDPSMYISYSRLFMPVMAWLSMIVDPAATSCRIAAQQPDLIHAFVAQLWDCLDVSRGRRRELFAVC